MEVVLAQHNTKLGTSMEQFLRMNLNSAIYFGQGHDVEKRFSDFRSLRLDYDKEEVYHGLILDEFTEKTGVLFLPFVHYKGEDKGDVINFLEKYMIDSMKKFHGDMCINESVGTSDATMQNTWVYVVIVPDEDKLLNDHGIRLRFRVRRDNRVCVPCE